jgi:hypothetical protein
MNQRSTNACLKKALAVSQTFFNEHNLGMLADELPSAAQFAKDAEMKLEIARKSGLEIAFVFPPLALQKAHMADLIQRLAAAPANGAAEEQQFSEPWVQDLKGLQEAETRSRPLGPYLLMYRRGPFPDETRNLTAVQLDKLFARNGWTSLTAPEYLVLQRLAFEENGDHRFDNYVSNVVPSQWMWLLDSRVAKGVVMAYWNSGKHRIEIGWCKENNKNQRRGAHPTMVVELELPDKTIGVSPKKDDGSSYTSRG